MLLVPPARLTAAARWRRLSIAILAAGATGAVAAVLRPRIGGGIHYEAIAAVFVVLPLVCLSLTLSLRRVPWRGTIGWLVLELSTVCLAFLAAWRFVPGAFPHDLPAVVGAFWLAAVVCCAALLIAWQRFRRPEAGPYCPGCDYCLIGTPSDRCPECGRDFDLRELGVTREELRASSAAGAGYPADAVDRVGG